MKIIITGASGNIGSKLLTELMKVNKDNVIGLSRAKHEGLFATDYSVDNLKSIFADADVVVHLAAKRGTADDYQTFVENEIVTGNILKAMLITKVQKIIFMSSIAVYSDVADLPWKEDRYPTPQTFYGLSKLNCENLCRHYANKGIDYIILRCGIVYGKDNSKRMISTFINQAMKKNTLLLKGKSIAMRDYIYVKDVVAAILWSISNTREKNQIFNLGSNMALTNLEVANTINEIFENDGNLIYDDSVNETVVNSYMNSSKISKAGFSNSFPFRSALQDIKNDDRTDDK